MIKSRQQYADKLDFIEIGDFENTNMFDGKIEGIDGIIHVASVSLLVLQACGGC